MTHDHAVRIVVSLVPQIEKSGAAKVLTDYATKEDLPPAQLEKLAQVFNTLRQVSHIDNADPAERGATVPLVDVPELVTGYATGLGREKAARSAPSGIASHDARMVDLNTAMLRELNGPRLQKAAAAPASEPVYRVSIDEVSDALLDLELDLRQDMAKIAGQLLSKCPSISHFERDVSEAEREALYLQPSSLVKAAGEFLEKFAAPHRITLQRYAHDEPLAKRAFAIDHELGELFAELAKTTGTYETIVKMAAGGLSHKDLQNMNSPESGNIELPDFTGGRAAGTETSTPPEKEEDERLMEELGKSTKPTTESATPQGKMPGGVSDDDEEEESSGGSGKGGGGGTGGGGKVKTKNGGPGTGEKVLSALIAPAVGIGAGIRGVAAKADETLSKITTKERQNKAQKKTDVSVRDIRRAINLRRMIGTDQVLREADPREVLDIYNSITELNPELADNMPALRLVLREAVSYEGLTLDSQKMLAEIYRNRAQGEQAEADNDRRRYAVGGASPIQINTK